MTDDLAAPEQIAIVGMAGRFPGAANVDAFWANLRDGVESIRPFTDEELRAGGADPSEPGFVNAGAVMDGIDQFDAAFFGMSRREAELTDPQHRVFLETAWTGIEHAGYDPAAYPGRVGVFGGVGPNTYFRNNVQQHRDLLARTGDYPLLLATEREYAITRVAYKLGLKGPALSVNTACSTSAVAVHLAIQSLLAGESDLAVAGGCRIRIPATVGYVYQEDGIPSPDGHCRAFDADARGTVIASGAAVVTLKRLSDAERDERHDLRGDQGIRGQQRRRGQDRVHGAEHRRAGGRHRGGAWRRGGRRRHDRHGRGTRDGHVARRPHRGGGADARLST